jgi:hypothetical protein
MHSPAPAGAHRWCHSSTAGCASLARGSIGWRLRQWLRARIWQRPASTCAPSAVTSNWTRHPRPAPFAAPRQKSSYRPSRIQGQGLPRTMTTSTARASPVTELARPAAPRMSDFIRIKTISHRLKEMGGYRGTDYGGTLMTFSLRNSGALKSRLNRKRGLKYWALARIERARFVLCDASSSG